MSPLRTRLQQRSTRFGHLPLGAEIALIVVVKLIVLYALYRAFFSAPQAIHMHMPPASVERHLLASTNSSPHLPAAPAQPLSPAPDSATLHQGHP
jgi:hypothetical protein